MRRFILIVLILLGNIILALLNPLIDSIVGQLLPGFKGAGLFSLTIFWLALIVKTLLDYYVEKAKNVEVENVPWFIANWLGPKRYKSAISKKDKRNPSILKRYSVSRFIETGNIESDNILLKVADYQDESGKIISVFDAIQKYPILFILGGVGSGKTTALKQIANEISKGRKSRLRTISHYFPIYLRINECSASTEDEFLAFISDAVEQTTETNEDNKAYLITKYLKRFIRKGNVLFLIDGISEVASASARQRIWNLIFPMIRKYSQNRFVFVARSATPIIELKSGLETKNKVAHVDLRPLDNDEIYNFLEHYFSSAVYGKKGVNSDDAQQVPAWIKRARVNLDMPPVVIDEIYKDLKNKGLLEILKSPLSLRLMLANFIIVEKNKSKDDVFGMELPATIHNDTEKIKEIIAEIPETRGQLLEKFVLWLLVWDQKNRAFDNPEYQYVPITGNSPLLQLLSIVAYNMLAVGENSNLLSIKNALDMIYREMGSSAKTNSLIETACELGLLEYSSINKESIRFPQTIIRDFFAALYLRCGRDRKVKTEDLFNERKWWGSLMLFSDLEASREEFIKKILISPHAERGFLAAECLGKMDISPEILTRIKQSLRPFVLQISNPSIASLFEQIGQLTPALVTASLMSSFGSVESEHNQIRIIRVLQNIHQREVVPDLINCLLHSSYTITEAAQRALIALQDIDLDILVSYTSDPYYQQAIKPILRALNARNSRAIEYKLIGFYENSRAHNVKQQIRNALVLVAGDITLAWLNFRLRFFSRNVTEVMDGFEILLHILFRDFQIVTNDGTIPLVDLVMRQLDDVDDASFLSLRSIHAWKYSLNFTLPPYQRLSSLRRNPFNRLFFKLLVTSVFGFTDSIMLTYAQQIILARWGDKRTQSHLYKAIHKDLNSRYSLVRYIGAMQCASVDDPELIRALGNAILKEKDARLRLNMLDLLIALDRWLALPILLEIYRRMSVGHLQEDAVYLVHLGRFFRSYNIPQSLQSLQNWLLSENIHLQSVVELTSKNWSSVFENLNAIGDNESNGTALVAIHEKLANLPEISETFVGNVIFSGDPLIKDLVRLHKMHMDNPIVLEALVDLSLIRGEYKEAIRYLSLLVNKRQLSERVALMLRALRIDKFSSGFAVENPILQLQKILGRQLELTEVLGICEQLIQNGNLLDAIGILEVVCKTSTSIIAYTLWIKALLYWGDWEAVINKSVYTIEKIGENCTIFAYLSYAQEAKGQLDKSLEALEKAFVLGVDRNYYETRLISLREKFDQVVMKYIGLQAPTFTQLLQHFPFKFTVKQLELISKKYSDIGLPDEAIETLNYSLGIEHIPETLINLSELFLDSNRPNDALRAVSMILEKYPELPDAHLSAAKVYLSTHDLIQAYIQIRLVKDRNLISEKLAEKIFQAYADEILLIWSKKETAESKLLNLLQNIKFQDLSKIFGVVIDAAGSETVIEMLRILRNQNASIDLLLVGLLCKSNRMEAARSLLTMISLSELSDEEWLAEYLRLNIELGLLFSATNSSRGVLKQITNYDLRIKILEITKLHIRQKLHADARITPLQLLVDIQALSELFDHKELYDLALECIEKDFRIEASELLKVCVQMNPKEYIYWAELGETQLRMGQYKEALETFDKGLVVCGNVGMLLDGYHKANKVVKKK